MSWRLRLLVETILRLTPAVLGSTVFSIAGLSAAHACLRHELLVLFGSRARGEARHGSDWDFGYLADKRFDPLDLLPPDLRGSPGPFPGVPARGRRLLVRCRAGAASRLRCPPRRVGAMTLDRAMLAEKASALERHLGRIAERLPARPEDLLPASDASDTVILHLWQAVQLVIDLAMSTCVQLRLGAPATYADALRMLAQAGYLDQTSTGSVRTGRPMSGREHGSCEGFGAARPIPGGEPEPSQLCSWQPSEVDGRALFILRPVRSGPSRDELDRGR